MTFGIDEGRNLIVQFLVFVQPYMQQQVIYHLETVLVLIVDQNKWAQCYMHLQIGKPNIALNSKTHFFTITRTVNM